MQEIYNKRQDKWKLQKKVIIEELGDLSELKRSTTWTISNANTVEEFYWSIVYLYTTNRVYNETNFILRHFRSYPDYPLGSYALMLNVIISQWTSLKQCEGNTYRGVKNISQADYTNMKNKAFAWPGFTSSTSNFTVGCHFAGNDSTSILFIINNSGNSYWKPKDIQHYSRFQNESECLYPASAMFKVTDNSSVNCLGQTLKAFHIRLQHGQPPNGCTSGGCVSQGERQSATPLVILVAVFLTEHAQSVFVV